MGPDLLNFAGKKLALLAVHEEQEAGWGILAIGETSPSLKPKHSFGIITEEQPLHVVAEFEAIKVFQAPRGCNHRVVSSEHNLLFAVLLHVIH